MRINQGVACEGNDGRKDNKQRLLAPALTRRAKSATAACFSPMRPRPRLHSTLVTASSATMASPRASTKPAVQKAPFTVPPPPPDVDAHVAAAWRWWRGLGAPRLHVAPMVDQVCVCVEQMPRRGKGEGAGKGRPKTTSFPPTLPTSHLPPQSELAFRMLARRHGATCAYTPMMHARLFAELPAYRAEQFTTTPADRPLLAQFCGNDPATVLAAARHIEADVDGVDLNLGCPQRIARRGRYGAFLMDEPATISAIVATLAHHLTVPVTAKMRIFDSLDETLSFARKLEASGASLVAVHGRTRAAKDAASVRADWAAIAAVKAALRVPVLANGDVRCLADVDACLDATGADGVLSAIPLLEDPALFSQAREADPAAPARRAVEYAGLAAIHPTPSRMLRGHAFRMLGPWLSEFTDLRDALNERGLTPDLLASIATDAVARIEAIVASGRTHPVAVLSERARLRLEKEEAVAAAVAEAAREEEALAEADALLCAGGREC